MNKNRKTSEHSRAELKALIKAKGITYEQVALEANKTTRTVGYFFNEGRESKEVKKACISLLNKHLQMQLNQVAEQHKSISLLQAS